jgi:hypothetical protein
MDNFSEAYHIALGSIFGSNYRTRQWETGTTSDGAVRPNFQANEIRKICVCGSEKRE